MRKSEQNFLVISATSMAESLNLPSLPPLVTGVESVIPVMANWPHCPEIEIQRKLFRIVYLVECVSENWGKMYVLKNREFCQYLIDEPREQINDSISVNFRRQVIKKGNPSYTKTCEHGIVFQKHYYQGGNQWFCYL